MKIIVHRGTKQIGGSCVEVQSGSDRILLDLGRPLPTADNDQNVNDQGIEALLNSGILPPIEGVYANGSPSVRAVIVSHVHQDHIGLAQYVHQDIPIYATEGTWALYDALRIFLPQQPPVEQTILPRRTPIGFGSLNVTAIPVDHSAPDAVAILVERGETRLLYTGDLRTHGRKSYLYNSLVSGSPDPLDVLLLEGTTVGRPDAEYPTEQSLEPEFTRLFRCQNSISLVFCSSQNLDRLVTIFRAAKRARKLLVIDLYTAYTLHQLCCISKNLPQWDWPQVRVVPWKYQQERLANAGKESFTNMTKAHWAGWKEIHRMKRDIVLLMRSNRKMADVEREFSEDTRRIQVIWSMWDGYWVNDQYARPFCEKNNIQCKKLHTSGHASWQDLQHLVNAIRPRTIVPIHTEHADHFAKSLNNVTLLTDGQSFEF